MILLTAFTGVFVGCGNKNASKPTGKPITLTINYSERESKGFSAETNLEMEVKIGDKTMPIKSNTTMDYTMNVDKVLENGDRLVSFKYDRIQSESGGMKWDSSNENESLGGVMLGAQLSPLLEPTIRIKISRAGKSTILSGTEELPPTLKPQVEEAMRTVSLTSGFPDHPVDNGDTWEDKLTQNQGGMTVSIDTTYTLLDMSDGIATIEAEGKMSGSMKGKVKGLTKLDIATGWLIQANSVAEGKSADAKMKIEVKFSGKVAKPIKGLNKAVLDEDLETIKQHIAAGTNINRGDSDGISPLHLSSGYQKSGEITELLLKHGAKVNAERADGATPIHYATFYNQIKSVEPLLRYGANLAARDQSQFGATPLHKAAWRSDPQILELLITEGAEVNSLDLKNQTPLDLAILHDKEDNVKILLKYRGKRKQDLERLLTLSVDGVEVTAKRIIKDFPRFEYFYITSSGAFSLDELRIGKTYESVTGDPSANDPDIIFSDSFDYLEGEKLVDQKGWYSISKPADCYTVRKGSLISSKIKSSGNRLSSDATDTHSGLGIAIPDEVSFKNEDPIYLSFLMRPEGAIGVGSWGGYFLVGAKPLDGKGILFGKPGSTAVPDDEKYSIDRQGGPHIVTSGVRTEVNKTSFVVVKMESNASGKKVSDLKPYAVQFDNLEERKGIRYLKNSDTPYTGKFFHIHSNGQKRATGDFKDGKPEGLMTYWYKNGQREMEGAFKGGKRNGQVIWWHENGQKRGEANFKDSEPISEKYWNKKGEEVDSIEEAEQ